MAFRAVIFDLDGLLVDSEGWIGRAWRQALDEIGLKLSDADFTPLVGVATAEIGRMFAERYGLDDEGFARLYARRSQLLMEMYRSQLTPEHLKPGAASLLDALEAHGVPRAIATLGRRPFVEVMLERTALQGRFHCVVCGEDVSCPKPDPQIFIHTARQLGVAVVDCIALEDSPAGITAAYRAGMLPILIPDLALPSPQEAELAYARFTSLAEAQGEVLRLLGLGNGVAL
ncbi:MAG: HAD family phosphatase [Anaerolineae bacterium]|nr:HAD family phosphatase [Anaerolineae bacterium]